MPLSYVVSIPGTVREGPISSDSKSEPTAKPMAMSRSSTTGAHDERGSAARLARSGGIMNRGVYRRRTCFGNGLGVNPNDETRNPNEARSPNDERRAPHPSDFVIRD